MNVGIVIKIIIHNFYVQKSTKGFTLTIFKDFIYKKYHFYTIFEGFVLEVRLLRIGGK